MIDVLTWREEGEKSPILNLVFGAPVGCDPHRWNFAEVFGNRKPDFLGYHAKFFA